MPAIEIDPKTTALVLIDLQNGIMARDTKPYSAAEVASRARSIADKLRAKGSPIVYINVDLNNFMKVEGDKARSIPPNMPAEASQIAEAAGKQPGDLLITKRHWGAFAGTTLEQELRSRSIKTVILLGIATNIGVESTLRQGTGLGFNFITVEDACATFSPEMQSFAFENIFPMLSFVRTTEEVLAALD